MSKSNSTEEFLELYNMVIEKAREVVEMCKSKQIVDSRACAIAYWLLTVYEEYAD